MKYQKTIAARIERDIKKITARVDLRPEVVAEHLLDYTETVIFALREAGLVLPAFEEGEEPNTWEVESPENVYDGISYQIHTQAKSASV